MFVVTPKDEQRSPSELAFRIVIVRSAFADFCHAIEKLDSAHFASSRAAARKKSMTRRQGASSKQVVDSLFVFGRSFRPCFAHSHQVMQTLRSLRLGDMLHRGRTLYTDEHQ